ncbi:MULTISPECIES: hypothetical protein [unclassified Microcoleus]|uniref:hypothetical protein n=1 Tax=unclassified Microcoleus TaxID=2642155 RepID=UPI002FCEED0D
MKAAKLEIGIRSQESGARRKESEGRRKKCFCKYDMLPGGLTHYRAEDLRHNPADDSRRECRSHMKLYNSSKFHVQE